MTRERQKIGPPVAINKYPFSPATYPGARPRYSFFFTSTGIYPCSLKTLSDLLANRGLAPLAQRFAILAYGSNACPGQLLRKHENHSLTDVPVLYGRMTGAQAVYSCRTTKRDGYVPATLARKVGSRATWINLLTAAQLGAMDRSEGRPAAYVLAEVSNVEFSIGRTKVVRLYAYIDVLSGVMTLDGKPVSLHAASQGRARLLKAKALSEASADWLDYVTVPDPNPPDQYSQFVD